MGPLNLPASGAVYVDANCVIYSVEKIAPYADLLAPLRAAVADSRSDRAAAAYLIPPALFSPIAFLANSTPRSSASSAGVLTSG